LKQQSRKPLRESGKGCRTRRRGERKKKDEGDVAIAYWNYAKS